MKTEFIVIEQNYEYALERAKSVLLDGGLFVFPTDTVYGLGCIYDNEEAVKQIYRVKGRDFNKPLAAYFSSLEMAEKYIKPQSQFFYEIANKHLPGAVTIIVEKNSLIPDFVTSGFNTIGIRIPKNKFLIDLVEQLKVPFVGTSANISNFPSAKTAKEAFEIFNEKIELVLSDDASHIGVESTVLLIIDDKIHIVRQGSVII